jgi:hypothetical protein
MPTPPPKRPPGRPLKPHGERQVKTTIRLYPTEVSVLTTRYGSIHAWARQAAERDAKPQ